MKNWVRILAGLILLVLPLLIPRGEGRDLAPAEKWVARYDGPAYGGDGAEDIAVDASGNIYVTGYSQGSGTDNDYATLKYNPSGTQLWAKRYNGPGNGVDCAAAIAVDGSGNVYVTGQCKTSGSGYDFATIKYNTNGKQLWVKTYNGPGSSDDMARAIAVDGSGNVYVTGLSKGSGTDFDFATIKFDKAGAVIWARRYDGVSHGPDVAAAIAVDGSGNVYVTGDSQGSGKTSDFATVKYSPSGQQLWAQRYNGPGNDSDGAVAITVDRSGNPIVAGWSKGSGTDFDYAAIKYSPKGKRLWAQRYNGPGNGTDIAQAVTVDGSNNVCVTGYSKGSGTDYDFATVKYNASGARLWAKRYNGSANSEDLAWAMTVDGSGNIIVVGESARANNTRDYATVKYSPSGKQLWVKKYDGTAHQYDCAVAVAADGSGNIYVTGTSSGFKTDTDYATVKY